METLTCFGLVAMGWRHPEPGDCLALEVEFNQHSGLVSFIMVFVMSLLLSAAMTNDRILRANRAPANDYRRASFRPIGIQLALRRGNWDKDNRANGLCPG